MQLSIHILCKFPNFTTGLNCPLGREGQNFARCVNVGKTEKLVLIGQEKNAWKFRYFWVSYWHISIPPVIRLSFASGRKKKNWLVLFQGNLYYGVKIKTNFTPI